jgi:hypothetical protein
MTLPQFFCTRCGHTFRDPRVRVDRRRMREGLPPCPQCGRLANPAGFHHRVKHVRRWWCRDCHAGFFTEPVPPPAPRIANFRNPDPMLREAAGLARAVQYGGMTAEEILRMTELSAGDVRGMRAAGISEDEIRRARGRREKIRRAFEMLLAQQTQPAPF